MKMEMSEAQIPEASCSGGDSGVCPARADLSYEHGRCWATEGVLCAGCRLQLPSGAVCRLAASIHPSLNLRIQVAT